MTTFLERAAWTTAPAAGDPLDPARVRGVALHWPGSAAPIGDPGREAVARRLEGYRRFHTTAGRGWADFAYNAAVDQAGRVWDGRGVGRRSAGNGAAGPNAEYLALLLLVGRGEDPSDAMRAAVRDWRTGRLLARYPGAVAVVTHSDVRPEPTECPGPAVTALVRSGAFTLTPTRAAAAAAPTRKAVRMILSKNYNQWLVVDMAAGTVREVTYAAMEGLKAAGVPFVELPNEDLGRLTWVA